MSMENAILEHAGALKELAAAIRSMVTVGGALRVIAAATPAELIEAVDKPGTDTLLEDKAAELAKATADRAAAARKAEKEDAARIEAKIKAEMAPNTPEEKEKFAEGCEKMVQTMVKNAAEMSAEREAKRVADAELEDAVSKVEADAAPLDYAKDVRPVLLAAIKKGKRAEIEAHLASAGVAKADQLKPEQLPAIFELAQKLAA